MAFQPVDKEQCGQQQQQPRDDIDPATGQQRGIGESLLAGGATAVGAHVLQKHTGDHKASFGKDILAGIGGAIAFTVGQKVYKKVQKKRNPNQEHGSRGIDDQDEFEVVEVPEHEHAQYDVKNLPQVDHDQWKQYNAK